MVQWYHDTFFSTFPYVEAAAEKRAEQHEAEQRGGCELWRSVRVVVALSLNMRSSGPLAAILAEMRGGRLSDGTWTILQERVLGVVRGEGGKLCRLLGGDRRAALSSPV